MTPALPYRMAALPVDSAGLPVPYFSSVTPEGAADFFMANPQKWVFAIKNEWCWVCGQKLGRFRAFLVQPICAISRRVHEPAMHLECAEWSVVGYPKVTEAVLGIYVTRGYRVRSGEGKPTLHLGPPESLSWWKDGRAAKLSEVTATLDVEVPKLANACNTQGELRQMEQHVKAIAKYFPADVEEGEEWKQ